jgi:anti-sigma factor RsiW
MSAPASVACGRVQDRLARLHDGALAPLEEARDRGHLEACAACQAEERAHLRLLALVPRALTLGVEAEAARLAAEVRRSLARAPAPRTRARFLPRPLVAAAVAAGLLFALRLVLAPLDTGLPAGPAPIELEPLLEHLPSWADLRAGLGQLSRWVS